MKRCHYHDAGLWSDRADTAIRLLSYTGHRFTADDLTDRIGQPPTPGSVGVAFINAKIAGLIRHVGYAPSQKPRSNGSIIGVWTGGRA